MYFQTIGSIPMKAVETLSSNVKAIMEAASASVIRTGFHLALPETELPIIIGKSGSTQGARTVSSPEMYEVKRSESIILGEFARSCLVGYNYCIMEKLPQEEIAEFANIKIDFYNYQLGLERIDLLHGLALTHTQENVRGIQQTTIDQNLGNSTIKGYDEFLGSKFDLYIKHDIIEHGYYTSIIRGLIGSELSSLIPLKSILDEILTDGVPNKNDPIEQNEVAVLRNKIIEKLRKLKIFGFQGSESYKVYKSILSLLQHYRLMSNPILSDIQSNEKGDRQTVKGILPHININIEITKESIDRALKDPELKELIDKLKLKIERYLIDNKAYRNKL
jgi:hypothetical protein